MGLRRKELLTEIQNKNSPETKKKVRQKEQHSTKARRQMHPHSLCSKLLPSML